MNILHLSPCQGAFGGIEAFVLAVADQLHREGNKVEVLFKKVVGFKLQESLQQALSGREYSISFLKRGDIRTIARKIQRADIIHGHNPLLEAVSLARWFKKPCVLTVYNWCRRNIHPRPLLWRMANRLSEHSWYISDFVWDSWEPRGRVSTSGKMPVVSSLPTNSTDFNSRKGFIFASRWIANKGIRILLEAYAQAKIDRKAWPLTLMGDGPLKKEVLRKIEELGLSSDTKVTGFITDKERNTRISEAKWMVTPPQTNEDLGLTVIEARNVKVPCIITNDGGLPEAAGKHSLVCKPGDAEGLALLLEQAAGMTDSQYRQIAVDSNKELETYLKPLSLYARAYRNALIAHGK